MAAPDPLGRLVSAIAPRAVDSIDLNEVMAEIDVDALLDRVDVDRLLDRVDVDRLLEHVDVERLVARVDLDAIIRRAQVDAIVGATARSFSHRLLDAVRRQLVGFDIVTTRVVDRVAHRDIDLPVQGEGTFTGQLAGGATRLTAFLVDVVVISAIFTGAVSLGLFLVSLFVGHPVKESSATGVWFAIGYGAFALAYQWITLVVAGRTIGKALVGLRVTAATDEPIGVAATTKRVLVYPFSFVLGLGLIGIVLGRRHRALHDVAAPSAVRYDWGDRPAEMPAPLTRFLASRGAFAPGVDPGAPEASPGSVPRSDGRSSGPGPGVVSEAPSPSTCAPAT